MLTINSTREPFDGISEPKRIDLKSYKIRGQGNCPPFINLIIIGGCIGLFIYVNIQFITSIVNIINGNVYSTSTQTFSCDSYYCDQTAYNFINYYSNYVKCNQNICQNLICGAYDCKNNQNYDINYYYACQPKCGPLQETNPPPPVQAAYIMSLVAVGVFGLGVVLGILYGIFASICANSLSFLQRFSLIFTWIWPKLKYYAFRRREQWEYFYFDLRCMVIVDMFINFCYAATLALYIALEIYGFWQTGPEIACFYLLIWATVSRGTMVMEVAGPFFAANRELGVMRLQVYS